MATVSKEVADDIIAGKYPEDCATRIVEYDNAWGGKAYGVTFRNEPKDRYLDPLNPYINNPRIYWDSTVTIP